jgi:hypothetical protein
VQPPSELNIFNVIIPLQNSAYFHLALWVLFFYFSYRMYLEWIDSEKKQYDEYFHERVWIPIYKEILHNLNNKFAVGFHYNTGKMSNDLQKYFIGSHIRFGNWFTIEERNSDTKIKVFRTPFNKYVWGSYYKYRIKPFFKLKYSSETLLPVTLILITLFYVAFPQLWCFLVNL